MMKEKGGKWWGYFFFEIDVILVGIGEVALKRENLGERGNG
jgi:hypothetical protein